MVVCSKKKSSVRNGLALVWWVAFEIFESSVCRKLYFGFQKTFNDGIISVGTLYGRILVLAVQVGSFRRGDDLLACQVLVEGLVWIMSVF